LEVSRAAVTITPFQSYWNHELLDKMGHFKIDGSVKSRKTSFFVIPAKAGIQLYQMVPACLDSGFHRSDDFLQEHQNWY